MIAMMAVVFSVAMFASCSDDDEGNEGDGTVVEATGVTLDQPTLSLGVGENTTLLATVAPENATDKSVTWVSSDPAIATVDSVGVVTGVAAGTATITVTTTSGGFDASCEVTVTTPKPTVGDIYYDDGTFSATWTDESKTPIGVIFHVFEEGAEVADPSLAAEFPNGLHGLVVSLDDYAETGIQWSVYLGQFGNNFTSNQSNYYQMMMNFFAKDYTNTTLDAENMVGYNNTLIAQAFNVFAEQSNLFYTDPYYWNEETQQQEEKQFPVRIEMMENLAQYNEEVPVPENASAWYVPSSAEVLAIRANLETINTTLEAIEREPFATDYFPATNSHLYVSSTCIESYTDEYMVPPMTFYNSYMNYYDFSYYSEGGDAVLNQRDASSWCNVRYVLAF